MDGLDRMLLVVKPIIFVILPAWGFHEWMGEATLGAVIGFSYMWNMLTTSENAQLAIAFREVRAQLDEISNSAT